MVYETNCTEITQDKWRELMKYGKKMLLIGCLRRESSGNCRNYTTRWLSSLIILMRNSAGRHPHIIYWFIGH